MNKYIIFTVLMMAAFVLAIVPTARTLDPFENTFADNFCEKAHIDTVRAFSILGCIFSGLGFFIGIAGAAGKVFKIPAIVISLISFLFAIPNFGYAAYRWDELTKCALPNFPVDFLAMWVCTSGLSLIAMIILIALADPDAAPADAGNVAPEEVKTGDEKKEEETPKPAEDNNKAAEEEAARKKAADEEAARKKKADEDAAAAERQRQQEEAARKQQQEQQDRDAAEAARKQQEEAAAAAERQRQQDAEAAAAKKKAEEEEAAKKAAAAANAKPAINWKEINAKLPYDKKNPEQKKKRFAMFDEIDVNKTGKVSLSEVIAGMTAVLNLPPEVNVPVVIKTAYHKAAQAGQQAGVNNDASGGDFIEKNEFRLFLMYTRMYFEMYQLFSELDETGDMCIELGEFQKAIPLLSKWGAKIEDAQTTFNQIDKNGGGKVLFDEFVDWALSPEQNLDCPDDDE